MDMPVIAWPYCVQGYPEGLDGTLPLPQESNAAVANTYPVQASDDGDHFIRALSMITRRTKIKGKYQRWLLGPESIPAITPLSSGTIGFWEKILMRP